MLHTAVIMAPLAAVLLGSLPAAAQGRAGLSWQDLVRRHCPARGVPAKVAEAVIAVESRGHAYALGVTIGNAHRAFFPASRHEALVRLAVALRNTENVDIGLMQLNWRTWGALLGVQPETLLDPETNIRLGCRLLGAHLAGAGPLWQRLGRYHSGTPTRQLGYARRVYRALLHTP